jgi:hypothetical protein
MTRELERRVLGSQFPPYGAKDTPMLEWASDRGLRYSPNGHCLHWISTGRCTHGECCFGSRQWMDHVTGWTKAGKPALLPRTALWTPRHRIPVQGCKGV